MYTKRSLCLPLAFLVMFGMLVSCASPDEPDAVNTAVSTGNVAVSDAEENIAPEYIAPDVSYDGAAFTVSSNEWTTSPWQINKYIEAYCEEDAAEPINSAIYRRNKKVEELFDITIGFYPIKAQSSTTELLTPMNAGDEVFQFAMPNGTSLPALIGKGASIYDLNDLTDFNMDASWWDSKSVEYLKIRGHNYMITGDLCFWTYAAPVILFYNKQIGEDYNIEEPYDMVRKGTWTIDELFSLVRRVSDDLDGEVDQTERLVGLYCYDETTSFVYAGGVRLSGQNENGDISFVVNNEKAEDIVARVNEVIHDKSICLWAGDHYKGHANPFFEVLMKGFTENKTLFFSQQLLVALDLRNMNSDYGILPYPKYDVGQSSYYSSGNTSWQTFVIVPNTTSDLEMCGNVLNALGYYSQQEVIPAFIDQTIMTKGTRDEDSAEMLDIVFNNIVYDVAFYYDWGGIKSTLYTILQQNSPFASRYAKIEISAMKQLEKTLDMISE